MLYASLIRSTDLQRRHHHPLFTNEAEIHLSNLVQNHIGGELAEPVLELDLKPEPLIYSLLWQSVK